MNVPAHYPGRFALVGRYRPGGCGDPGRCWVLRRGLPVHVPAQVFADLTVAIADGGGRVERDEGTARPGGAVGREHVGGVTGCWNA